MLLENEIKVVFFYGGCPIGIALFENNGEISKFSNKISMSKVKSLNLKLLECRLRIGGLEGFNIIVNKKTFYSILRKIELFSQKQNEWSSVFSQEQKESPLQLKLWSEK
jgi:hypothetical protein